MNYSYRLIIVFDFMNRDDFGELEFVGKEASFEAHVDDLGKLRADDLSAGFSRLLLMR